MLGGNVPHWVVGIHHISRISLPSSDACVAKGQKPAVMSGTQRFNTSYSAEGAGKVVFKHCQRVIYLPKRYVEQMSDRVKSLGWSLQLLSSLWCFSEAVLPVFIHLPLWVTAEQLRKKKKKLHDSLQHTVAPPPNHPAKLSQCYYFIFYFCLCCCQYKDLTPDIKSNDIATIPSILIQSSFALFHPEKLTIRMKNGAGISKYKPVDYERLQAIIDAKRLETDALREKVIFLFSVSCCCY